MDATLFLSMSKRADGRSLASSLRPLRSDQALLNRADGSACFAQGATCVLAAVYGPEQAFGGSTSITSSSSSNTGKLGMGMDTLEAARLGIVEVTYKPPGGGSSASGTSTRSKENQVILARTLSQVITLSRYPQTAIRFTVQVLDDCGSALATAFNACSLALVDAGVAQSGMVVAICVAVMPGGEILLDPSREEEASADAVMMTAWHSVSREILACRTAGIMTRAEFKRCRMAAREAVSTVLAFMRMSFVQKCRQQYDNPQIVDISEYLSSLPIDE